MDILFGGAGNAMEYLQYLMGQCKCQFDLVRHCICVTSALQWQANCSRTSTSRSPSYANRDHVDGDISLAQWLFLRSS